MARRKSVAWALLAAVGACSESSHEAQKTSQSKVDQTAIPISVRAPMAPICAGAEAILPLSKACDTGLPSLYSDMDAAAPLAFAKCVWKTFEAQLSENEALRFRLQDCSMDPEAPPIGIESGGRALKVKLGPDPKKEHEFLRTYELNGVDAVTFLEQRRQKLTPAERDRCVVRPYEATDFTGRRTWNNLYEIAPNPDYMAELEARQEPVSACGEQGWTNDGVQFWELRAGEAWFWELGQDTPLYDPRSFTILHKRSEGSSAWDLEDMKPIGLAN